MISKVHGAFILLLVAIAPAKLAAETFVYSGGCFWCTEADSEKLEGVSDVISGFSVVQLQTQFTAKASGVITARLHK